MTLSGPSMCVKHELSLSLELDCQNNPKTRDLTVINDVGVNMCVCVCVCVSGGVFGCCCCFDAFKLFVYLRWFRPVLLSLTLVVSHSCSVVSLLLSHPCC